MKKLLAASFAVGTILSAISAYATDDITSKQINLIDEKTNTCDEITPENIRSHPENINITLTKVVASLNKLGKYKSIWNNDVLEIYLKSKQIKTPLLKFQKSGNVINGHELYEFAGGSQLHDSIGSVSLEDLQTQRWKNSFQNYLPQFEVFKKHKRRLNDLLNKQEPSDDDVKLIMETKINLSESVEILDTVRMRADETHQAIVELYLDILGFSRKYCMSENPFIEIKSSNYGSGDDYKDWREVFVKALKYDEFKMLVYSFMLNASEIERNGKVIFTPQKKLTLEFYSENEYQKNRTIKLCRPYRIDPAACEPRVINMEIKRSAKEFSGITSVCDIGVNDEVPSLYHELCHDLHFSGRNNLFGCEGNYIQQLKRETKHFVDVVEKIYHIEDSHEYSSIEIPLIINILGAYSQNDGGHIHIRAVVEIFAIFGSPYEKMFGCGLSENLLRFSLGLQLRHAHYSIINCHTLGNIIKNKDQFLKYPRLIQYNAQQMKLYFKTQNYVNNDCIEYMPPKTTITNHDYHYKYAQTCDILGYTFEVYNPFLQYDSHPRDGSLNCYERQKCLETIINALSSAYKSMKRDQFIEFIFETGYFSDNFKSLYELTHDLSYDPNGQAFFNAFVKILKTNVVEDSLQYITGNLSKLQNNNKNIPNEITMMQQKFLPPLVDLKEIKQLYLENSTIPRGPHTEEYYTFMERNGKLICNAADRIDVAIYYKFNNESL